MEITPVHEWQLTCSQARTLQFKLQRRVEQIPLVGTPEIFGGVDCSISPDKDRIIAGVVVMQKQGESWSILEQLCRSAPLTFPYVPGLLSFREAPVCLEALKGLTVIPDVFLFDGQGLAHPRRLGLASHVGLFIDRPTIGCAKSRLTGRYEMPGTDKGASSLLTDGEEIIGRVVRTRNGVKPVFVSIGHRITLDEAVRVVLDCTTRYRLPEPARAAHRLVTDYRQSRF